MFGLANVEGRQVNPLLSVANLLLQGLVENRRRVKYLDLIRVDLEAWSNIVDL